MEGHLKGNILDDHQIARRCVDSLGSEPCLRYWNGEWYRWDGCAYRKTFTDAVKKRIHTVLHRNRSRSVSRSAVGSILETMRLETLIEGTTVPCWLSEKPKYPADEIVSARNGLLHVPGLLRGRSALLPHTPSFFTLNALDYDYRTDATCPQWERFLNELWCDDAESIRTLQEWFGYLLLPDTSHQKFLMMIGPTRSGKGTIARIVRMMLGESNVASPTIRGLSGSFGLWGLVGKTLAIVPDASVKASSSLVELIKSLTGEDALDIDRKNLAPLSGVDLTSRLMVVANQPPAMVDPSGALAQRMIILETRHSWAGKEDRQLTARLATELPGILLWSIDGWRRLRKRGHFRQPRSSRHLVEQYGTALSVNSSKQSVPPHGVATKTITRRESMPFHNINLSWNEKAMQITIRREEQRR
jgi:putative DNA primase/helicase